MEASDVTLKLETGYVVISLQCHPEDGDRWYGVAQGEVSLCLAAGGDHFQHNL
jgi:hypothetical protein